MQYSGEVPDIANASSMVVPLHRKKILLTGTLLYSSLVISPETS